jgi:hypothetical protein
MFNFVKVQVEDPGLCAGEDEDFNHPVRSSGPTGQARIH